MTNFLLWAAGLALLVYPLFYVATWVLSRYGILPREWFR